MKIVRGGIKVGDARLCALLLGVLPASTRKLLNDWARIPDVEGQRMVLPRQEV